MVRAFSEEAQVGITQLLIPGDFALAWGYGLILFGLLALLVMRLPDKWLRVGSIVMWVPLLASVLDCMENIFLFSIVTQLVADEAAPIAVILPLLAGVVATLKWIALAVVTPVFGFAGIVKGIGIDRRVTSWIVYVLLFIALLSMVVKPIQDIPTCF